MQNEHLDIQMIDVGKIIPYWRNPRRNDRTVETLMEVIPQYGFNVPIVIDKDNVVVKGHARLKAAKRLGMQQVPCVVSTADAETIKADRIADNKIQEMSFWDFARLEIEFQKLGKMKFERLFKPEEASRLDLTFEEPEAYEATQLNNYDDEVDYSSYTESQNDYAGNYVPNYGSDIPQSYGNAYSSGETHNYTSKSVEEWEQKVDAEMQPQPIKQATHRVLRTVCPHCAEVNFIEV